MNALKPSIEVRAVSNALDFVESALRHLDSDDGQAKFAILHLHVGIETLLKARLAFEDRKLVAVKRHHERSAAQFDAGHFTSISFNDALEMTQARGLRLDERTKCALKALSDERNRIAHFAPGNIESLRGTVVATLAVVLSALADPQFAKSPSVILDRAS